MPARWSYYAWRECDSDWTNGAFSDKDVQALEDLFMGKTMTCLLYTSPSPRDQ